MAWPVLGEWGGEGEDTVGDEGGGEVAEGKQGSRAAGGGCVAGGRDDANDSDS